MKKVIFTLTVFILFAFAAKAQTKKDGTPDMRYKSNKEAYGNSYPTSNYSTPSYSAPSTSTTTSDYSTPSTTTSRPVYPGQTHTESHGGSYVGSTNSHHKNGIYVNPKSNNSYGIHKTKNN